MTVDLEQLKTFCDLCSTKSFTKTAKNIGVTESTVSYRIRELEKFFGKKLFVRMPNKTVDCTEFGNEFYPQALNVIDIFQKNVRESRRSLLKGEIKVSAGEIGGVYLLPAVIKAYGSKYHDVSIDISINNSQETINKLNRSLCDIGLVASIDFPDRILGKNVIIEPIAKIQYGIITPPGHPLLTKSTARITDLKDYPYISRGGTSGSQREILKIINEAGLSEADLNVVVRFEQSSSVINAVAEGLGIGVVSRAQAARYVQGGFIGFIPLVTGFSSYLTLLDRWRGNNPLVNSFTNFIKYYVKTTGISF
ncbi:LysR family transcriptional regulator [Thermoplasmatales archaeon AK]|nr:LysR family transcriptional regulator [Thermoplasmatales archaeon AK]